MKLHGWMLALAGLGAATAVAAQDLKTPSSDQYVPRLGDIMGAAQTRHQKLWLAGKAQNWDLAAFELRQLKASLVEAAVFYSGIPIGNVATLEPSLQAVSDAIDAKDGRKFAKGLGDLTDGCNACHRSLQRGFVVIKVPGELQPFANQQFAPAGKP
ncbi:hypothetical protein JQ554_02565 [Bradyrhizobium diazoefficiens]|nr:hypothetical protein [Bradyrhizobium diazoefficiens]UCF53375.1 MAG: hypothetical protein JSV48_02490 [Bradyrhizobium sp.]MBR0962951.1 hypothetical protein [Bradyrhizobium diazoefficiens]MBR0977111.1 hypothetical protein [Bradyrhizobium diazoefficiens]MBR1005756.1 hypothetical protein [Bradyrhizobium diazoefficiens]MBR1012229.1 hypothetical protein [Bradyrhizobium diazoefficiens]